MKFKIYLEFLNFEKLIINATINILVKNTVNNFSTQKSPSRRYSEAEKKHPKDPVI